MQKICERRMQLYICAAHCRGRCRSQLFAAKARYGCGSAACRYASARQNAPVFMELCVEFVSAKWADRVVGPYSGIFDPPCSVGADDSVRPLDAPVFTRIYGEFVTFPRADVGIGPYNQARKCIRVRRGFSMIRCMLRAEQSPAPTNTTQNPPLPAWKSNRRLV